MADGDDGGAAKRVERSVTRTIGNTLMVLVVLGLGVAWLAVSDFFYTLQEGEASVVLRLGKYNRTEVTPGPKFKLPEPFETRTTISFGEIRREKFGYSDVRDPDAQTASQENAIQTSDGNIVNLSYVVQYTVNDAFRFHYAMAHPEATLRGAAEASMREVIGTTTVEAVLAKRNIEAPTRDILQQTLDEYFGDSGLTPYDILRVQLQVVQAPRQVQDAFDDVVAAQQDDERRVSEARGDAREIVERAGAQANEIRQEASAYREALITEAQGEAQGFEALLTEYLRAPQVTRQRLYLETMEEILPGMQKIVVDPDAVDLLPIPLSFLQPATPTLEAPVPVSAVSSAGTTPSAEGGDQ